MQAGMEKDSLVRAQFHLGVAILNVIYELTHFVVADEPQIEQALIAYEALGALLDEWAQRQRRIKGAI